jgi:hypothetical protein
LNAVFDFSTEQAAASMAKGQHASVPIQSLLMQINADAVCLVRTQFQQLICVKNIAPSGWFVEYFSLRK